MEGDSTEEDQADISADESDPNFFQSSLRGPDGSLVHLPAKVPIIIGRGDITSQSKLISRAQLKVTANENGSVILQQPALGPRDAIPGETTDRFEQARPELVVQVLRLQLLRRQRKIAPYFRRELLDQSRSGFTHQQPS